MIVTVDLPEKKYDILIESGVLENAGQWLESIWPTHKKIAIITDQTVAKLYLDKVTASFVQAGFNVISKVVPDGESSKSLEVVNNLVEWLASEKISRTDGLVTLGGGVVGDLAGFVSGIYMRGVSYVQIPTSLLAQVDSSVGGKTAVNHAGIKNLIGVFNQPDGVLIDPNTLQTLPNKRVSEGLAEIVKTAAILDARLWRKLDGFSDINAFLKEATPVISRCCELKSEIVVADEKEKNQRLLLNFGHTIGHGLESVLGSDVISHGEAVAVGMYQLSLHTAREGLTPNMVCVELANMLSKFNLSVEMPAVNYDKLVNAIENDKKNKGTDISLVYLNEIGKASILVLPFSAAKDYFLREEQR